jgi:flagellar basal body-associated protein FliL
MATWLRTTGVLACAGALAVGAWWTTERDTDILRLRRVEAVTTAEEIVPLEEATVRLADGWSARISIAVVTGQPDRVRAQEAIAAGAVVLTLSRFEHDELLGPDHADHLRRALLASLQEALPDAEVERVLVTQLVIG